MRAIGDCGQKVERGKDPDLRTGCGLSVVSVDGKKTRPGGNVAEQIFSLSDFALRLRLRLRLRPTLHACGANYLAPGRLNFACGANYPHQALKGVSGGLFCICVESRNLT